MQVEFTSLIDPQPTPAPDPCTPPLGALRATLTTARLLERHNFDRLLIGESDDRSDPRSDPCWLAAFLLHNTVSLSIAVTHRAGAALPTEAAEKLAALDQRGGRRLSVRIANGLGASPSVDETALGHQADLARTEEYLVLLKRLWANDAPFDHEGPFYSLRSAYIDPRPFSEAGVPLILGGASGTAIKIAARHADVFTLAAASPGEVHQVMSRVLTSAQTVGRGNKIRFAIDIRPVVAASQGEAAKRAAGLGLLPDDGLAGTPERVALALLRFCELGVSEFVVHGLEIADDIALFGDAVIPLVRRSVDRRRDMSAARPTLGSAGPTRVRTDF